MQLQLFPGFRIVPGRSPANMPDHYVHFFAHKNKLFGKFRPDILSIDVAVNALQSGLTAPDLTRLKA